MQNNRPAPHEQIFSIVVGYWQANAVAMVAKLGLADLLAQGPMKAEELAERTRVNAQALFRMLRALESVGIYRDRSPNFRQHSPERRSPQGQS